MYMLKTLCCILSSGYLNFSMQKFFFSYIRINSVCSILSKPKSLYQIYKQIEKRKRRTEKECAKRKEKKKKFKLL